MIGVILSSIEQHAKDIFVLGFAPEMDVPLPPAAAGAHIRIVLPNGLERCYSLVSQPGSVREYSLAINLDSHGDGGSRYLCETARIGDRFCISAPLNQFSLIENAPSSFFIAGGIGITPIWSMIQRLEQIGGDWHLFYAVRERACAAFLAQLESLEAALPGRVSVSFGDDSAYPRLDIAKIVQQAPASSHLYCCGPKTMLDAFKTVAAGRDPATVHWEHFSTGSRVAGDSYTIELARNGQTFFVPAGKSVLDILIAAGLEVAYGCKQGICGACQTNVLDGIPQHNDMVLSDEERASNKIVMICCSGAVSERLVLDL